jgi:putative SOS response-associated peptidase YedK
MEMVPIWNRHYHGAHLPEIPLTWLWVRCEDPHCGHARAVPVTPWIIRWGITPKDICPAMRASFYCGVCGRRGRHFGGPMLSGEGIEAFPPAGKQVRINGPKRWNETYPAAEERNRAEYITKYPTGDALGEFRGLGGRLGSMCNLYSVTSSQQAIRNLVRAMRDTTGNLPSLPSVFPDMMAPVVRTAADGIRELMMTRWGFPPPTNPGMSLVTNVRNTASHWWKPWLQAGHRCLVPVNSFCEWTDSSPKVTHWFALDESRPPFFFAGLWRPWTGTRGTKANLAVGDHLLFSFLTTEANATVAPIHTKAMPVCLLTEADRETWLTGSVDAALALQRPAANHALRIVATGSKSDPLKA